MKWDTDRIIGTGLIAALIIYIIIVGVVAFFNNNVLPLDVASNIVTGLAGYMGRSLLEKARKEDHHVDSKPPTAQPSGDHQHQRHSAEIELPERKPE